MTITQERKIDEVKSKLRSCPIIMKDFQETVKAWSAEHHKLSEERKRLVLPACARIRRKLKNNGLWRS